MPKIIFFGNLPVWVGGRQTSGASEAMWQLADSINGLQKEYIVDFVATDFFKRRTTVSNTVIYGWNYGLFIKTLFLSAMQNIALTISAKRVSKMHGLPFFSVYVKMVLFNAIVKRNKEALFHVHGTDYFVILQSILSNNNIGSKQLLYTVHAIAGNDINIPVFAEERIKEREIASYQLGQLFFVSKQLQQEWLAAYGPKESLVIPNGIGDFYIRAALSKPSNKRYTGNLIMVTIGSLTERKGQIRVLEALRKCNYKERITYRCIGSCDDVYLKILQSFAKENGINFEYLGIKHAKEIIKTLSAAHYMILPSSSEGFGLVYLESLCTGTPVILPKNLPIVNEMNLNEHNAILLEDHSSEAITEIINKIYLYSFNVQEVRNSFTKLSWNDVAEMYIKQYKKI